MALAITRSYPSRRFVSQRWLGGWPGSGCLPAPRLHRAAAPCDGRCGWLLCFCAFVWGREGCRGPRARLTRHSSTRFKWQVMVAAAVVPWTWWWTGGGGRLSLSKAAEVRRARGFRSGSVGKWRFCFLPPGRGRSGAARRPTDSGRADPLPTPCWLLQRGPSPGFKPSMIQPARAGQCSPL